MSSGIFLQIFSSSRHVLYLIISIPYIIIFYTYIILSYSDIYVFYFYQHTLSYNYDIILYIILCNLSYIKINKRNIK